MWLSIIQCLLYVFAICVCLRLLQISEQQALHFVLQSADFQENLSLLGKSLKPFSQKNKSKKIILRIFSFARLSFAIKASLKFEQNVVVAISLFVLDTFLQFQLLQTSPLFQAPSCDFPLSSSFLLPLLPLSR